MGGSWPVCAPRAPSVKSGVVVPLSAFTEWKAPCQHQFMTNCRLGCDPRPCGSVERSAPALIRLMDDSVVEPRGRSVVLQFAFCICKLEPCVDGKWVFPPSEEAGSPFRGWIAQIPKRFMLRTLKLWTGWPRNPHLSAISHIRSLLTPGICVRHSKNSRRCNVCHVGLHEPWGTCPVQSAATKLSDVAIHMSASLKTTEWRWRTPRAAPARNLCGVCCDT